MRAHRDPIEMLRRCRPLRIGGSSELNSLSADPVAQGLLLRIMSEAENSSVQASETNGPKDQIDPSTLVVLRTEGSREPRDPRSSDSRSGSAGVVMWAAAVVLVVGLSAVALLRREHNGPVSSSAPTTAEILDVRARLTTLAQSAPVDGLSIDTSREVPPDSIPPNSDSSRKASVRYGNQADYVEIAVELGDPAKSVTVLSAQYEVLTVASGVTVFSRIDSDEMQAVYAVKDDLFVSVSASGSNKVSIADLSSLAQYVATNW